MRIKFKGEDLGEFNGQPRIKEARLIKSELGMLPMEFGEALNNGDPECLAMMVAIMMNRRDQKPVSWEDIDGEYDDFDTILTAEEQAQVDEAMKQAGLDPVGKGGRNGLHAVASPGSSEPDKAPQALTWTGPSPVTPSDSGGTTDSPS